MNRRNFCEHVESFCNFVSELVQVKSYAYGGRDPLKCFRKYGLLGLLIRLQDKVNRWETFLEGKCTISTKDWKELLADIMGYCACAYALLHEKKNKRLKDD